MLTMNITRENNELVIRLPMEQDSYDAIDELVGRVPNLIGVIAEDEQGIHQSIDMTYKGKDPQVDGLLVQTYYPKDEFIKKCAEWGISIIEYSNCGFCQKTIYGSCTLKNGELCCFECEHKK
jgi:hypothetical protein